jgi:hypothetical protein
MDGWMELLTVVTHELGHVLGLNDLMGIAHQDIMVESLKAGIRRLAAGGRQRNPFDVDNDGYISPSDALFVINYLNRTHPEAEAESTVFLASFLDVDGDSYVSPSDAPMVINYLNANDASQTSDAYFEELGPSTSEPPANDNSSELLLLLAIDQLLASNGRRGA